MSWVDYVKLFFPYLLEILKVVMGGPHTYAVQNLKEKGYLPHDSK